MTQQNWRGRLGHWWYIRTGQETAALETVTDKHIGGAGPAIKVLLLVAVSVSLLECVALDRVFRFVSPGPKEPPKLFTIWKVDRREAYMPHMALHTVSGSSELTIRYTPSKASGIVPTAGDWICVADEPGWEDAANALISCKIQIEQIRLE